MSVAPNLDLRPDHWAIVRDALSRHVPDREVLAFGSRATWTAKDYSDLDLAIMGEEPLSLHASSALDETLVESDLPFRVDIVDWARTDDSFRRIIRLHGIVVQGAPGSAKASVSVREPSPTSRDSSRRRSWPTVRLGDHADACLGKMLDQKKNRGELFPYLGNKNVRWGRFDISDLGQMRFGDHEHDRYGLKHGDLVVCEGGEPGRCAIWKDEVPGMKIQKALHRIRAREQLDNRFLHYWFLLAGRNGALEPYFTGTTIKHLTGKAIAELQIPLPPKPEQRAIAHVLGTLDDKIELNRRMNETLEAMARALFKSWFVDFDPVRAKMEGRDTGLPRDIAALFPDRMVDSEMGQIPEGWEAKSLKDCMNLTMGQSPPGRTYNDHGDGLPFFQGRSEFGFRYPEKRRFCSAPTRVANPEDTLVSVRAPVGDLNLAWERCCIGRGVAALRHKSGSSSYTYHSAWSLQRELKEYEHTGTVFGAINKGQFQALKVTDPDPRVVEAFDTISVSMDARIRSNTAASRTLAGLRDTLLPKLISGEIRVPAAERLVESVP